MVSEVVATCSRGCEKTVNLVGQGKLNSTRQPAEPRITSLLARPTFHAMMGGVWERDYRNAVQVNEL